MDLAVGTIGDPARPIMLNGTRMRLCYVDQAEGDADLLMITVDTWGQGTELQRI